MELMTLIATVAGGGGVLTVLAAGIIYVTKGAISKAVTQAGTREIERLRGEILHDLEVRKAGLAHDAMANDIVWQNQISYRKSQLEELYGPIYAMLKTTATIYGLWIDGKLPEANWDIKRFFEENNNAIRKILTEKAHLVDEQAIPPSFAKFMTSAMIWNWYCAKDLEAAFPPNVKALQEVKWSTEFEEYIYKKTEELKKGLYELHKRHPLQ